jgi:dephospho-CoA kinase
MIVIGITGGICSGKSTVVAALKEEGIAIIDADILGHKSYTKDTDCYRSLVSYFGEGILDSESGEINRRALGTIVFSDKSMMEALNGIVWPEIRKLIICELDKFRSQDVPLVALEAAVMIEAKWYDLVDSLWVVGAEEEEVIRRLSVRNGLTTEQARIRIAAQISFEDRKRYANVVIHNGADQTKDSLKESVLKLLESERAKI